MTISQPDVTVNILPAQEQISNEPQRVLLTGVFGTFAGTAGALIENFPNDSSENATFGENSELALMIKAYKSINQNTRLDVIPLAAGAGANAAGTITVTGTATAAGTITIKLGNFIDDIKVSVANAASAATVAAAINTALNAVANYSSAEATAVVTLTYDTPGVEFNELPLVVGSDVTGITLVTSAFTGGTLTPTLTTVFDVITDQRYQTVLWPFSSDLTVLTTFLDARFNATNDVLDGVGIVGKVDTFSNLETAGNAENSESLVLLGDKTAVDPAGLITGGALQEAPYVVASLFGSIRSKRLTVDTNISALVITPFGGRDQFGGPALSTLPYFNSPLTVLDIIPVGFTFTREEIEDLQTAGVSVISNNIARNTVIVGEVVTTKKTDAGGNPEKTFKFLNAVDAASVAREFFFNNLRARFRQSRLVKGAIQPGRSMANQIIIEAELDGLYTELSEAGFVVTVAGENALQFFKANRTVTIDEINGSVAIDMQVPIVTQLRTILANMQIAFSIT